MPDSPREEGLRERLLLRTRQDAAAMRSALAAHEFPMIVQKAHRLAGAAGALGLDALGGLGRMLEGQAARADADAVRRTLGALGRELDRVAARRAR